MVERKGILDRIEEPKVLKEGTKKDGKKWVLYGAALIIDGERYGMTAFSKAEITKVTENIRTGDEVSFQFVEDGKFLNIEKGSKVDVLSSGNKVTEKKEEPTPQMPSKKSMTEEEVFKKTDKVFNKIRDGVGSPEELVSKTNIWITIQTQINKESNMARWDK